MRSTRLKAVALLGLLLAGSGGTFSRDNREQAWKILIADLSQKDPVKRADAVRVLSLLPGNAQALDFAQRAVRDEKPEVRSAAAVVLGELHSRPSVPLLHGLLDDNDPSVVLAAASALLKFKDPAAYEVYYQVLTGERKVGTGLIAGEIKTLKNPRKMAKVGIEQGLGFIPFASLGYSALLTLRVDDISPIRAAAAKMLASDKDQQSGAALVRASADKSWIVRAAALEAIARRGDPHLLDGILPAMSDTNVAVRCTAAVAVIRLSSLAQAARKNRK
jgi:HEAT repeat protein